MTSLSRRGFLATAAGAATAVSLRGRYAAAAKPAPCKIKSGADIVAVGETGIKTSVLGIGTGTRAGREQRDLGYDGFTRLMREAFDRGIRYIDTADMYKTHDFIAKALKELTKETPRDEIFIQTKTRAKTADAARDDVDRFLAEMEVDYVDTLLVHCTTKAGWPVDMRPVMDVLSDAKAKGKVRAIGFSCHGWAPLVSCLETDWPDVQLNRINPFDEKMDGEHVKVADILRQARARRRGVIGMKIYGEGVFRDRQARYDSIKYVLGLGCVDCFTIGFKDVAQIDETMEHIEKASQELNSEAA